MKKINTETELRKIIKSYPKMLDKRIQDGLDELTSEYLQHARLAVLSILDPKVSYSFFDLTANHEHSQLKVIDRQRIALDSNKLTDLNKENLNKEHRKIKASLFFFIPGIHHAVRLNGSLHINTSTKQINTAEFIICQAYFHCGRAAIRSNLWKEQTQSVANTLESFCQLSSYALLTTEDAQLNTQLSPRGDKQGLLKLFKDQNDQIKLFMPERPGNKIAISLRNILENPTISLIAFIPNSTQVLKLSGQAYVTDDPELLALGNIEEEIKGKTIIRKPKVGIVIDIDNYDIAYEPALEASGIWQQQHQISEIDITAFSKALSTHISGAGLFGKLTHTIVDHVVEADKKSLY